MKELIFSRIVFLLLVLVAVFYLAVDRNVLRLKTVNYSMPSAADIKVFNEDPEKMSREQLTDVLIYYKNGCHFIGKDPEQPAPCSLAAYAYYYLGNATEAIRYYTRAIQGNEYFFWFYYNMGAIYFNEGLYEKASEQFARALTVDPDKTMLFFALTKTYREIAFFLGTESGDYVDSLKSGYESAREFQVASRIFAERPEVKDRLNIKKIKLRLF